MTSLLVSVVKIVAGHDSLESVLMGQHKSRTDLVLPIIVPCTRCSQNTTAATMTSLVIVVVNKHHSVHTISHTPTLIINSTKAVEVSTPNAFSQFDTISELGNFSNTKIFLNS